ncbi:MAG: DUF2304 domain-containing protein [Actinomycetota bacterium]|nr:DUF2304 domain-containing protein [Actinomycetota bacterium]
MTVSFIVALVRRRQLRAKYSMLWLSLGAGMILLAASPKLLDNIASRLGVLYPPAILFLLAIVLLITVSVHFSWELSRLEDRIRSLAQEVALLTVERADDANDRKSG